MKIWFPLIRADSGSDVYAERLVAALQERSVDAQLQWFDRSYEYLPHLLRNVAPPTDTDLIHAISSWSGFAFAHPPLPLIVTAFHCVYRNGYPQWKTRAQALYHDLWIGRLEKRSFAAAAAVVALTPSAAEDFQSRFILPHLSIIPGWVDTSLFKPAVAQPEHDGKGRILIVGNASKRKGMDLLPALVEQLGSQFAFTVIGGLRGGHANRLPGVIYKQGLPVEALVEEYQQTDIVVSLSRYEGFGYTALEAIACGKPVVAFNVTGIKDVVAHGVNGYLAAPERIDIIAHYCQRIIQRKNTAREISKRPITACVEKFLSDKAIDKYLALYKSTLEN